MIGQTISGVHARHNYDRSPKPRGQVEMGFPALWQGWIWCGRQIFSYATQSLTIKNIVTFSGTIDSEEMTEIITNLCSLEGLTQVGSVNNFDFFDKYDLGGVYYLHVCWCLLTFVGPKTGTLPGVSFVYLASKLRPEQLIWWHFWAWLACQTSKHWVFFLHILIYTFLKYYFSNSLSHIYSSFIKVSLFCSEPEQFRHSNMNWLQPL